MDRVQGVNSPGMLRPSLEIKALHNLIGRYWNGIVPRRECSDSWKRRG